MASGFAPFVSLALDCRTIYSLAWRRPAGLTHTTEQDRRWISMQSLLPSSAMCNWSVSSRETTRAAHNRKVLEGKLTVRVFSRKFVEIPKQKVFFRDDELKWRWHWGFLFLIFFTCISHISLREMHMSQVRCFAFDAHTCIYFKYSFISIKG